MPNTRPSTLRTLRSLLTEKTPTPDGKEVRNNLKLSGIFLAVGFIVSFLTENATLPEDFDVVVVLIPCYISVKLFMGVFKTAAEVSRRQTV